MRTVVFVVCFFVMNMIVLTFLHFSVSEQDTWVAAVFPSQTSDVDIINAVEASNASMVRDGKWRNIVVITSEQTGLASRLKQHSALLTVNPKFLQGCGLIKG